MGPAPAGADRTYAGSALAKTSCSKNYWSTCIGASIAAPCRFSGLIAYSVGQRTHEIGIRLAIGAQRGHVLRLIVGEGLRLATIGVALGLIASFLATRVLKSMLFGVTVTDPLTFTFNASIMIAVALFACYIPARRATKVDPMTALRYE